MKKLLIIVCLLPLLAKAQPPVVLDKIIAVVGEHIVMISDVEQQYLYLTSQEGMSKDDPSLKCKVLEDILFQKLLLNQAKIDSVEVSDAQVEAELEKRIGYYMNSPVFNGDVKKFEAYYGKPMSEIKDDFRRNIRDQLLSQQVQQRITADIKTTPNDISRFFNSIPKDSLPYVNSEVEIGQLVREPVIPQAEKDRVRNFLHDLREEIKDNQAMFAAKALIYSEDPGSRVKGGELGFVSRDQLVPEFAAVAFSLKDKFTSEVVETEYGFHIIQLIERRGEMINVRHILITPKMSGRDMQGAEGYLDSLRNVIIRSDSLPFQKAAEKYSSDKETRKNGGLMVNPQTNSTKFDLLDLQQIDKDLFFTIDKMEPGDVSKPIPVKNKNGEISGYKLIYLKSRTKPHVISIKDDYTKLQAMAEADKKRKAISKWIDEKRAKIYIKIMAEFISCSFQNKWIN